MLSIGGVFYCSRSRSISGSRIYANPWFANVVAPRRINSSKYVPSDRFLCRGFCKDAVRGKGNSSNVNKTGGENFSSSSSKSNPRKRRVRGRGNGRIYGSQYMYSNSFQKFSQEGSTQIQAVREALSRLDNNFKYNGFHTLRWVGGLFGLFFVFTYGFRDDIKENIGSTGAEITMRTLGDEEVQKQARELARGVVYELLNDKRALDMTTIFVNDLLGRDYTRQAVLRLLSHVASLEETQVMLSNLFQRILRDEYFMSQLSASFSNLITLEETQIATSKLMASVLADPANQTMMADFFQRVSETETFRDSMSAVGTYVAHTTISDEEVHERAIDWARSVLGQPEIHSQAGDAMWEAIRTTFIPGFLGGGRKKQVIFDSSEINRKLIQMNQQKQMSSTTEQQQTSKDEDSSEKKESTAEANTNTTEERKEDKESDAEENTTTTEERKDDK